MMCRLIFFGLVSTILLLAEPPCRGEPQPYVTIGAIFEGGVYTNYAKAFYHAINEFQSGHQGRVNVEGLSLRATDNLYDIITSFCARLTNSSLEAFVVVGNENTIHMINMIASSLGIPVLGYNTDVADEKTKIHNDKYLHLEPSKEHLAKGMVKMLSANEWFQFSLVIEDTLQNDGFYSTLRQLTCTKKWTMEENMVLPARATTKELGSAIGDLKDDKSRIIVLHCSEEFARRIFAMDEIKDLTDLGHTWILTENAVPKRREQIRNFPIGTIALKMTEALKVTDIIYDSVGMITTAMDSIKHFTHQNSVKRVTCSSPIDELRYTEGKNLYQSLLKTNFHGKSGPLMFDEDGTLILSKFKIKSLASEDKKREWKDVGFIRGDQVKLSHIVWPGKYYVDPFGKAKKRRYRVVTNPVKPFVMVELPHRDYRKCYGETPCLNVNTKDKDRLIAIMHDYENGIFNESNQYEVRCCRGLTIDLLNELARDLDFEFTLYLVADKTYGAEVGGEWNGMVRELIDGTAHMAVAAMSITRPRARAIDFTDPYFFSRFSVLVADRGKDLQMHAFLEPFSIEVWFAIILSATTAAITMAFFEWNSPFGLNPWGRKRKQNYTLASGVTMVYSILFGHTVKTKSPKAWPSKVMQNFWAFACIFIIASYTANMASFIAGKSAGHQYQNIYDPKLLDIRVGILEGSAVEASLKRINQKLYLVSKRYTVPSTDVGIERLIASQLDGYLGDYPILDYARAKLDPKCELKLMSQFGEDGYGIGLPKGSPLKASLSEKIYSYHQNGKIDELVEIHFADAQCYQQRRTQEESQLAVTHHAGLFVMLSVGIGVGIMVCFLEHAVYKWLVPYLRLRPGSSNWRSIHLMFISQRLHRIITSAELVSAHDSAKEILGIMRNRDFTRLFQKSTIRKNKLADMAKTKRLNRNFYDVVEKAKWMQELRDKQLIDDSPELTPTTPHIVEIPLKEFGRSTEEAVQEPDPLLLQPGNGAAVRKRSTDWPDNWQADWLLNEDTAVGPWSYDNESETTKDASSNEEGQMILLDSDSGNHLAIPDMQLNNSQFPAGGSQILFPTAGPEYDTSRHLMRFDNLPNGHISCGDLPGIMDDSVPQNIFRGGQKRRKASWCGEYAEHSRAPLPHRQPSLPIKNNRVKALMNKRRSFQVQCDEPELIQQRQRLDQMTKEELVVMWKTSEVELNKKLDNALREKALLEEKLARMEIESPV